MGRGSLLIILLPALTTRTLPPPPAPIKFTARFLSFAAEPTTHYHSHHRFPDLLPIYEQENRTGIYPLFQGLAEYENQLFFG